LFFPGTILAKAEPERRHDQCVQSVACCHDERNGSAGRPVDAADAGGQASSEFVAMLVDQRRSIA
jgi:hypothetical protein